MDLGFLRGIRGPADVKALDSKDLPALCDEIRRTLVRYGKAHGGHIGSNLAVVEITVALHRVFDSPRDAIIFDVSHQSYVHKMLTGRAHAYMDPSLFGSVTGFTNPEESEHDHFVLGHTGTSVSLACGLAKTRDMTGGLHGDGPIGNVIAVIGDGALSSAVAFEGLNNAAEQGGNLIVIVNDNEMSIAENVGGMYRALGELRASRGTSPRNPFTALGLDYRYVESGNDVRAVVHALEDLKDIDHPTVLHIHTRKGLGLDAEDVRAGVLPGPCESNHWQDPIDAGNRPLGARKHYGRLAMRTLESRFGDLPGLVVISPATPGSNGITREFRIRAGTHYVDTGIAEEHAVAFASGIAKAGGTPVLATSSTFFQRAFDELQQELSLNRAPVTLLVFAAGISGTDNTHSGAFDIPLFSNIPDLTCLAPAGEQAFIEMLNWSVSARTHGGVVIRVPGEAALGAERSSHDYPRFGGDPMVGSNVVSVPDAPVGPTADGRRCGMPFSRYRITHRGSGVAIIGLGNAYPLAEQVAEHLQLDIAGPIDPTVIDPQQYSSLDAACLETLRADHRLVVTIEDGQLEGGWGEKTTAYYANARRNTLPEHPGIGDGTPSSSATTMRVLNFGALKEFTDRIPLDSLNRRYGLTPDAIARGIRAALGSQRLADPRRVG